MRSRLLVVTLLLGACGEVAPRYTDGAVPDAATVDGPAPDAEPPPNLILNGTFDNDTLNWTAVDTELTVVAGGMQLKQTSDVGPGLAWQLVILETGVSYTLNARFVAGSYPGSYQVRAGVGVNDDTYGDLYDPEIPVVFTIPTGSGPGVWITCNNVSAMTNEYAIFDDVTLIETP